MILKEKFQYCPFNELAPLTCLTLQVVPLPGKRVAMVLVLEDEVVGVLEDQAPGEEDQHPGDHRGGASGAGSPTIPFSLWSSNRTGNPLIQTLGRVTLLSPVC